MNCNSPYATRSKKRNAVANPHATRSRKRKAVDNPLQPVEKKSLLDLPYHIITDILIRLPAECVIRCQRASRFLQLLVTTPFFIRTHLARRATSIIALQSFTQSTDQSLKFYFIDERDKKVEEANLKLDLPYMLKDYPVMLYNSYDGFLLLKNKSGVSNSVFVIWNPTTAEQVTITMEGYQFKVCGFYFNANNKEYEVLFHYWVVDGVGNGGISYSFDVLSFGSRSRRNIGIYPYVPRSERPPANINGTLYWMVDRIPSRVEVVNCSNSIMAFEIKTNKLRAIQHGGASCDDPYYDHDDMHLIEMEGQLGLCVLMSDTKLLLQVLNPATNSWVKTHIVTLPKLPECSTLKYFSCWPSSLKVEAVMKDGKLLVRQNHRLLLCDLDLNTRKIVNKRGFEDDNFRPVVHTHSIVSLNTYKMIELDSE